MNGRALSLPAFVGLLSAMGLIVPLGGGSGEAIAFVHTLMTSGALASMWLLGAVGLGAVAMPLVGGLERAVDRWAIRAAVGLAVALFTAHLLGVLGVTHPIAAWLPSVVGIALLLWGMRGVVLGWRSRAPRGVVGVAFLGAPVGLLVLLACVPPGSLWPSEGNGYDVLEYHLQLPKEWLGAGAIRPLEHNVYSYLPSYMEAAYAQMAAMVGVGQAGLAPLGAGGGTAVLAASLLHALVTVLGAWIIGVLAARLAPGRRGGVLAAALVLTTPWVVVVGSLAYNDSVVLALFAAALLVAVSTEISPAGRGAIVGLLMGGACSVKATALFMCVPAATVFLVAHTPRRDLVRTFAAAGAVGLAMLGPWLVRNAVACGNPVFPHATGVFGAAHWSAEQVARWGSGHHVSLSIVERVGRLVDARFGFAHPQWSIAAWVGLASLAVALVRKESRRSAALVGVVLVLQLIAWLGIGHLQSRFLLPTLVPLACGFALAASSLPRWGLALLAVAPAVMFGHGLARLSRVDHPLVALAVGVEGLNGSSLPADLSPEQLMSGGQAIWVNRIAPATHAAPRVLLVGGATPLYFDTRAAGVVYATTWDTSPIAGLLAGGPMGSADMGRVWSALAGGDGITHILIDLAELDRLRGSGWLDPAMTESSIGELLIGSTPIVTRGPRVLLAPLASDPVRLAP